jgi:hypothetical protein
MYANMRAEHRRAQLVRDNAMSGLMDGSAEVLVVSHVRHQNGISRPTEYDARHWRLCNSRL